MNYNQQQDQYSQQSFDNNAYPQVTPHSGQYMSTSVNQQYQSYSPQQSTSNQQFSSSYATKRASGLAIFNIPIFTHFNPKNAIVNLYICGKTGDLVIQMAPAIPNNPAIGLRGPVPAGTKVYDYDKEVVSAFSMNEVYDLVNLLQNRFTSNNKQGVFTNVVNNTNMMITSIKDYMSNMFSQQFYANLQSVGAVANDTCTALYNAIGSFTAKLTELINQNNQMIMNATTTPGVIEKDTVGMYRKGGNGDDKAWNFNYDSNLKMLHINLMAGRNKENKCRISLSSSAAQNLLRVLESYINNYTVIQILCKTNSELSKTLAHNNLLAPTHSDSKRYQ